ncbi:unnamed protein product [Camellia sinensis]
MFRREKSQTQHNRQRRQKTDEIGGVSDKCHRKPAVVSLLQQRFHAPLYQLNVSKVSFLCRISRGFGGDKK